MHEQLSPQSAQHHQNASHQTTNAQTHGNAPVQMRRGAPPAPPEKDKRTDGDGAGVGLADQKGGGLSFREVLKDLGTVVSMESAFSVVGGLLDALAPFPNQGIKGEFKFRVAPPGGFGAYVDVGMSGTVARDKHKKLKVDMTASIGFGARVKVIFGEVSTGLTVKRTVSCTADNGYRCLRLFGLAIHESVSSFSNRAANWLFGKSFEADVIDQMVSDEEEKEGNGKRADSVSWEGAGELGASGKGEALGNKVSASAGFGIYASTNKTKTRKGDRRLHTKEDDGFKIPLSVAVTTPVGSFSLQGTYKTTRTGREVSCAFSYGPPPGAASTMFSVAQVADGMYNIMKKAMSLVANAGEAMTPGEVVGMMSALPRTILATALQGSGGKGTGGLKAGQSLLIELGWKGEGDKKLAISNCALKLVGNYEVAALPDDMLTLKAQSTTTLDSE